MFQVILPFPFVQITVVIPIPSIISIVIFKIPFEFISIIELQITVDFKVILPVPLEKCSIGKFIFSFSMLLPIHKLTNVSILIGVFQLSHTISKIMMELPCVYTAISIGNPTLSLPHILNKLSLVNITVDIDENSLTLSHPLIPLPFIFLLFLRCMINSIAIFLTLMPLSRIICSIVVEIDSCPLLQIMTDFSLVHFSRAVYISTLSV